ncbi:MAG: SagB/ThcOx family dehydrogenase [Hyphomicrobiales bacterium]
MASPFLTNVAMLNPNLFFYIDRGRVILWDYEAQSQFDMDGEHLDALFKIVGGESGKVSQTIVNELHENNILVENTALPQDWGWDRLAHIFHFGTQMPRHKEEDKQAIDESVYLEHCSTLAETAPELHKTYKGPATALPDPDLEMLKGISLWEALFARMTSRQFGAGVLSLDILSTVLYATFYAIHGDERKDTEDFGIRMIGYRRSSPSAGGLQSPEPYVLIRNVENIAAGLYHYSSRNHTLTLIGHSFDDVDLGRVLGGQMWANEVSAGVFLTSSLKKLTWKYPHSRSYRDAYIDIGALLQTFQLTCAAFGISCWMTGYFLDREIDRLLGINCGEEISTFFIGVGAGKPQPLSKKTMEIAAKPSQRKH